MIWSVIITADKVRSSLADEKNIKSPGEVDIFQIEINKKRIVLVVVNATLWVIIYTRVQIGLWCLRLTDVRKLARTTVKCIMLGIHYRPTAKIRIALFLSLCGIAKLTTVIFHRDLVHIVFVSVRIANWRHGTIQTDRCGLGQSAWHFKMR